MPIGAENNAGCVIIAEKIYKNIQPVCWSAHPRLEYEWPLLTVHQQIIIYLQKCCFCFISHNTQLKLRDIASCTRNCLLGLGNRQCYFTVCNSELWRLSANKPRKWQVSFMDLVQLHLFDWRWGGGENFRKTGDHSCRASLRGARVWRESDRAQYAGHVINAVHTKW